MKDVNQLLERAKEILDELDLEYCKRIKLKVSSRMTRRWGCAVALTWYSYEITINDALLQDNVADIDALNVMVHELLHCHYDHHGHRGRWLTCAKKVTKAYPELPITRTWDIENVTYDHRKARKKST